LGRKWVLSKGRRDLKVEAGEYNMERDEVMPLHPNKRCLWVSEAGTREAEKFRR